MSRSFSFWILTAFSLPCLRAQDSVATTVVAPGVLHSRHLNSGPLVVNVLSVDLTNPSLRIESYRPIGLTPTSRQAGKNSRPGHIVIAAVNADFFSFKTQWPLSNQVVNGRFILGTKSKRSHVVVDERNRIHFERLSFHGVATHRGRRWEIDGVNTNRTANETVFYNSSWGPMISDSGSIKFVMKLVGARWIANDTLRLVVMNRTTDVAAQIPEDGGLLSTVNDLADAGLNDTLSVFLGFAGFPARVADAVGGAGRILESGRDATDTNPEREGLAKKFLTDRHPRSFVGINRDTTQLLLCTVDGRQPSSVGMSFHEMAAFLLSLGLHDAINLDGGGSTTMVCKGSIVNSPSDKTGERGVANSLQVISIGQPE